MSASAIVAFDLAKGKRFVISVLRVSLAEHALFSYDL
jgi:hypothetical protein